MGARGMAAARAGLRPIPACTPLGHVRRHTPHINTVDFCFLFFRSTTIGADTKEETTDIVETVMCCFGLACGLVLAPIPSPHTIPPKIASFLRATPHAAPHTTHATRCTCHFDFFPVGACYHFVLHICLCPVILPYMTVGNVPGTDHASRRHRRSRRCAAVDGPARAREATPRGGDPWVWLPHGYHRISRPVLQHRWAPTLPPSPVIFGASCKIQPKSDTSTSAFDQKQRL